MSSLRVGLIGAGQHGRYLSPCLREAGPVELVAAADSAEGARAAAQRECGYARTFEDYRTMLDQVRLDAVVVATPHHLLADACQAALAAGCHVFCEKPLALNLIQAKEVVSAAERAHKTLMVGYCLRFNQTRLVLKRLIDDGALGRISAVVGGKGSRPWSGWLAQPAAAGGGQMLFLGSHLVDQVLWLTDGTVEEVYAQQVMRADTGADDTSVFTLRFAGDLRGELLVSQSSGVSFDYVELTGTDGRARADWPSMLLHVHSAALPQFANPTTTRVLGDSHRPMYVAELAEFLSAVREERSPSVDGRAALRTLAVLDAVFASAASGKPVRVSNLE